MSNPDMYVNVNRQRMDTGASGAKGPVGMKGIMYAGAGGVEAGPRVCQGQGTRQRGDEEVKSAEVPIPPSLIVLTGHSKPFPPTSQQRTRTRLNRSTNMTAPIVVRNPTPLGSQ